MGLININSQTQLTTIQCGTCGVWHAIPSTMYNTCVEEGGFWHCPNGHRRGFNDGTLRAQLEKEKKRREWAEHNAEKAREREDKTKRKLSAQKGVTTKLRNRAKHGVCPCCNRTFKQLAAHMKNKHPDWHEGDPK